MEQTHDSPTALELYKGHPVQEASIILKVPCCFPPP